MLYKKLSAVHQTQRVSFLAIEAAIDEMRQAQEAGDLVAFIEARVGLVRALFPLVDDYYLEAVLVSLLPAGQRLCFMAGQNPEYDMRDTLRHTRAVIEAVRAGDLDRVEELVRAHWAREERLAQQA